MTRIHNKLTRLIAEEDEPSFRQHIEKLKEPFDKFETAHERYHSLLENEDDVDESDKYFFEVEKDYITSLSTSKSWLKSLEKPDVKTVINSKDNSTGQESSAAAIAAVVN